jgi:hypothetical protein
MARANITSARLRQIVREEISEVGISEAVDHGSIRDIVTVASKLLAAVEGFKKKAPHAAVNAVTPHIDQLERALEDMVNSPGSYVPVVKKQPQKVSLKPSK